MERLERPEFFGPNTPRHRQGRAGDGSVFVSKRIGHTKQKRVLWQLRHFQRIDGTLIEVAPPKTYGLLNDLKREAQKRLQPEKETVPVTLH